jgi:hypothetical protein
MTRRRAWTHEQIELLRTLLDKGVSALRASVVLKRPKLAVQNKARQLGTPFPDIRSVKAERLVKEARERVRLDADARHSSVRTRSFKQGQYRQ